MQLFVYCHWQWFESKIHCSLTATMNVWKHGEFGTSWPVSKLFFKKTWHCSRFWARNFPFKQRQGSPTSTWPSGATASHVKGCLSSNSLLWALSCHFLENPWCDHEKRQNWLSSWVIVFATWAKCCLPVFVVIHYFTTMLTLKASFELLLSHHCHWGQLLCKPSFSPHLNVHASSFHIHTILEISC